MTFCLGAQPAAFRLSLKRSPLPQTASLPATADPMTVRRTVAAMISPTGTEPAASVASVSAQLGPLGHTSPLLPHDGQPSHGSTPHLTLSPEVGSMSHSSSDSAHDGSRIHFSPLPKQTGPPSHCSALSPQVGSLSHSSNPCQPLSSQTGPPSHCSPLSPQVGSLSHSSNPCQPLSSQTGPLSHSAPESSQTAARAVVASTDIPAHVTAGPYPGDLTFALHTADHCDITAYVTVRHPCRPCSPIVVILLLRQ